MFSVLCGNTDYYLVEEIPECLLWECLSLGGCPVSSMSGEFPTLSWWEAESASHCGDWQHHILVFPAPLQLGCGVGIHKLCQSDAQSGTLTWGYCHKAAETMKNLFCGRARAVLAVASNFRGTALCPVLVWSAEKGILTILLLCNIFGLSSIWLTPWLIVFQAQFYSLFSGNMTF